MPRPNRLFVCFFVSLCCFLSPQDPRSASLTTHRGESALSWAALCGQLDCVQLLLEGETEGGGGPVVGGGVLHHAASVGVVGVCQALLAAGAKVGGACVHGCIQLHRNKYTSFIFF